MHQVDGLPHLAAGQVLHGLSKRSPHDLFEPCRLHASLLQLFVRFTRIHGLMLRYIARQHFAVVSL